MKTKHKTHILTMGILFILLSANISGCANYTYNGIRGSDLKNLNQNHIWGGVVSFAVHTLGHYAAASTMGYDIRQEGLSEIIDEPMSDEDRFIFGAGGFAAQLALGYGMKLYGLDNDFTKGYNAATLFEISTYPLFDSLITSGSDINEMNQLGEGAGSLVWGLATIGAIGLNMEKQEEGK